MVIKKFLVLFAVLLSFTIVYAEVSDPSSFTVEALSFQDENIVIDSEVVFFSDMEMRNECNLRNVSDKSILLNVVIKCYPTSSARWLFTPILVPNDFKLFVDNAESEYKIKFNEMMFTKDYELSEREEGISEVIFQIRFDSYEEKKVIITYRNVVNMLKYDFDTGDRLVERHFFSQKSKEKSVVYITNDNNLGAYSGFALLDFLFKKDNEYFIVNDFSRIYENNHFEWRLAVPDDVTEVVCRQDHFYPSGGFSPYNLLYNGICFHLDEDILFKFKGKSLSKELLSKSDIFTLSKRQLSILRNSFYAKYGYEFKNKELKSYFESNCKEQQTEYRVNPHFSESCFNDIERKNIELISELEKITTPLRFSEYINE